MGYWAPQPSDVPAPESVLDALALLDVYTGPTECAPQGYLVHTGCVRFSWKPTSVEERLSCLPRPAWRLRGLGALRIAFTETFCKLTTSTCTIISASSTRRRSRLRRPCHGCPFASWRPSTSRLPSGRTYTGAGVCARPLCAARMSVAWQQGCHGHGQGRER